MSLEVFEPFTDAATFFLPSNQQMVRYVGGAWWLVTATTKFEMGNYFAEINLRCSLPYNLTASFEAEIMFLGLNMPLKRRITITRDGWIESSGQCRSTCSHFSALGVMIQVFEPRKSLFDAPPSDVVFEVEGKEFPANIGQVSKASNVFNDVFKCEFPENEPRRIKIDGVSPADFQNFLDVLLRRPNNIGNAEHLDDKLNGIRELADRYDAPDVLKRCVEFLCRSTELPLFAKFKLAEQWNDQNLITRLTGAIVTTKDLKALHAAGMMTELSPETQKLVMNKAMTLI
ncbi:Protein BATH-7 [Aphelenchoides avenae]|nr:Protein BATH-7 [Aphelenchus avenae]